MSGPGCYFSVKQVSRELEVGNRGGGKGGGGWFMYVYSRNFELKS